LAHYTLWSTKSLQQSPLQRLAQFGIAAVERQAQQGMRLGDGGQPAGQGDVGALAGQLG